MRSIRKFTYATFLMLSTLALQPSLAAAEDGRGHFTLPHEVCFRDKVLPAGDYDFSVTSMGPSEILTVRNISHERGDGGVMVLVNDVGTPKEGSVNQLTLVTRNGRSFVSSLELPEFAMVLHFAVPAENQSLAAGTNSGTGALSASGR